MKLYEVRTRLWDFPGGIRITYTVARSRVHALNNTLDRYSSLVVESIHTTEVLA